MNKCIGGIVHDSLGDLLAYSPGKSFGQLFEEKKQAFDSLQAGLAASVMPSFPPMPAVKYSDFGIGVDFHKTLLPAMPLGPVPNICMVFDIMGVVFSGINTFLPDPPSPPDIYGRTRSEIGEAGFIPFLYQGQYLDTETGLAYNRFRYYSPETGAYISQDPIRLEAGLTNLYAYVHDTNAWIDPWGLDTFYQLFNGDTLVYEGITKRDVQERLIEHASSGKSFTSVRYVDDLEDHIAARDMEGSSLYNNQLNKSQTNKRRNDAGFYHSYDPNNIKDERTFISKDDIELKMSQGKTAEVDSKGHIKHPTH